MPPAPLPHDETARLAALHSYAVLDTQCEQQLDDIARLASHLAGCPIGLVSLVDADRQWFKACIGLDVRETPREQAFCAHAILAPAEPLVVPDATRDPRFADNPLVTGGPAIRAYCGIPLVNPEGHALGTLCVIDRTPRDFAPGTIGILQSLARMVATTLELRRAMRQARALALSDAVTGLPNRPAFLSALMQAMARQRRDAQPFALIYLDLDGFKRVNDLHGHREGDVLLAEAAAAMRAVLRIEDTLARIGGDEFAAVLVNCDAIGLPGVAERLCLALKARMDERGWPVTASVGAVLFRDAPEDEAEAMAAADELMYAAKAAGRNRVVKAEYRRLPVAA